MGGRQGYYSVILKFMIELINKIDNLPYKLVYSYIEHSRKNNDPLIDAIAISSFNKPTNEVETRFVNLKFIDNDDWIFFSNYESLKAQNFKTHNQIAALLYWPSINVQIRIKANIKKTSNELNQKYFFDRSQEKNALAISSNQSRPIDSYNQVEENYNKSLKNDDLKKCPEFWGGYTFTPYYFEFWEGHESRLNKREAYEKSDDSWRHLILQP
jgi:pyridoxamine 5'-phosphate oxidase